MTYFKNLKDVQPARSAGHISYDLLDEENGCVSGCRTGVSEYYED